MRADGIAGRARDVLAAPLDGGWRPFFGRTIGDVRELAAALAGARAALGREADIAFFLDRHRWD